MGIGRKERGKGKEKRRGEGDGREGRGGKEKGREKRVCPEIDLPPRT